MVSVPGFTETLADSPSDKVLPLITAGGVLPPEVMPPSPHLHRPGSVNSQDTCAAAAMVLLAQRFPCR
jgi:hypothetical protein